jgi:hypothetical protein
MTRKELKDGPGRLLESRRPESPLENRLQSRRQAYRRHARPRVPGW